MLPILNIQGFPDTQMHSEGFLSSSVLLEAHCNSTLSYVIFMVLTQPMYLTPLILTELQMCVSYYQLQNLQTSQAWDIQNECCFVSSQSYPSAQHRAL